MSLADPFDNTAPVGISLASQAFDNTAPDGVSLASQAFDNTPPVGETLPNSIPDNTPPGVIPAGFKDIGGISAVLAFTANIDPATISYGNSYQSRILNHGDYLLMNGQTDPRDNGVYRVAPGAGGPTVRVTAAPIGDMLDDGNTGYRYPFRILIGYGTDAGKYYNLMNTAPVKFGVDVPVFAIGDFGAGFEGSIKYPPQKTPPVGIL